jgi:CheY-like chemotaxis protein
VPTVLHPPSPTDLKIIFGEDDIDDIEILAETFSEISAGNYTLDFIHQGRKVIETLDSLPDNQLPCLLVLDYNMPELNGAEILAVLQKNDRYKKIPKVIWSTSGSDTYKNKCLELGAADYLIKPGNLEGLVGAAKHLLSLCHHE